MSEASCPLQEYADSCWEIVPCTLTEDEIEAKAVEMIDAPGFMVHVSSERMSIKDKRALILALVKSMIRSGRRRKAGWEMPANPIKARPFLKWVGGKGQLLPELLARIPEAYNNYYEPFLGGGALFFALQPKVAILSDINPELINAYEVIQANVAELITLLRLHSYNEDHFYKIRDLDRSPDYWRLSRTERAARIIFLNKTCFNGLYRVNRHGHFNVPFGRYTNPTICDEENLLACHAVLRGTTFIKHSDYIRHTPKPGAFVYFDPPYAPLTATSNFTGYDKDGFGDRQQRELCNYLKLLDRIGVQWMLSNSSAPLILELYKDFNIELVDAKRSVNSDPSKRGAVKEVIVRNYGGEQ